MILLIEQASGPIRMTRRLMDGLLMDGLLVAGLMVGGLLLVKFTTYIVQYIFLHFIILQMGYKVAFVKYENSF